MFRTSCGLVLLALLAACGGDDESSSGPTGGGGSPVTPISPPSTTTPDVLLPTSSNVETSSNLIFNTSAGQNSGITATDDPLGFGLAFSSATNNFTIRNSESQYVFGTAQLYPQGNSPYFPASLYRTSTTSSLNVVIIFKQCNCEPAIGVTNVAYGSWQQTTATGVSGSRTRLDYFLYGSPTPQPDIPTTGTTAYRWAGTGNAISTSQTTLIQHSGTLTVDWGTRTFSTMVQTVFSSFTDGSFGGGTNFSVTGTLAVDKLTGVVSFSPNSPETGTFRGQLFGPNAKDIGFIFTSNSPVGAMVGAAVGTTP